MVEQETAEGLGARHWVGAGAVALLWFYSLQNDSGHVKGWAILPLMLITAFTFAGMMEQHDRRPGANRWFTRAWLAFGITLIFSGWLPEGVNAGGVGDGDWW